MLQRIREFIGRYVILNSEEQSLVLALWVLHTWAFEAARTTPYIYVHSPEKQSGKTRLIETLEVLVRNPMRATDMTTPVLFRAIESMHPTILLDEVDAIWAGAKNDELRGTLNGGYKRGGHVWRLVGQEPTKFSTFSPKLLAGINNGFLPDTIADRCIPIIMQRKPADQSVEHFFAYEVEEHIEPLLDEIVRWVENHESNLMYAKPEIIPDLSDREWEISSPLIAIADEIGAGEEARRAITTLIVSGRADSNAPTPNEILLGDIRDLFDQTGSTKLFTQQIVEHLGDRAWNHKTLSCKLSVFGVKSKKIRVGNTVSQGYTRESFEDAWRRYL